MPTKPSSLPRDLVRLEGKLFASLNELIEPRIRAGWGAPGLVPAGVIVLETTGRVSGATRRVPVMAARLADYVLVATFRGGRSQWIKNLAATPRLRYWSGGTAHQAVTQVFDGESVVPRKLRWLKTTLAPSIALGWAFALLSPLPTRRPKAKPAARRKPAARTRSSAKKRRAARAKRT